ncbi:MAG: GNAT family N-acetyltransferase [Clostridia bacterium]|nr:GNAT family N-acetyltransferase [Clostridia bacterium]
MIRQANSNHSSDIAKLIISGWQTAYKGLIDDNFLSSLSTTIISEKWEKYILSQNKDNHIYVYEEDDKILGVIRFGKPDDKSDALHNAEIHVLYVEPSLKRHGIGSKLFDFAKEYFVKNNYTNMIIWCLKENSPSIKFYEKMGGKIIAERKATVNNIDLLECGLSYNLSNIVIKEYEEKYAEAMSKIIIQNLFEINIKDYGEEYVKKSSTEYTVPEITKSFPQRTKVFVALENNIVVGTAGIDKSWYNDDGEYWILTVFVDIKHHKRGIGTLLLKEIEKYAQEIHAKKLVIPASIFGCEFYHKLGYEYQNGKKELNKDKLYIMEKCLETASN